MARKKRADGGDVDSRFRSKNEGDFRQPSHFDFGDSPAYRGNPSTRMTNDSLGNIRSASTANGRGLIGINDPRPEDPRQAADDLMENMYDGEHKRGGRVTPKGLTARGAETLAKLHRRHGGCV